MAATNNPGMNSSAARGQGSAQANTSLGMRVEQVKPHNKKEALQSLINKATHLNDKKELQAFVAAHLPNGKHFDLVLGALKDSKGFNIKDIASFYGKDKNAADAAYWSLVKDEHLDYFLRRNAAANIQDKDKRDNAYCHLLKTVDPRNDTRIDALLFAIDDTNKKKSVCYELLPSLLAYGDSFSTVASPISDDTDFEKVLSQSIRDNIEKTYINSDCCLRYIENSQLKAELESLLHAHSAQQKELRRALEKQLILLDAQAPTNSIQKLTKKLDSISKLDSLSQEEKEDLFLQVIKANSCTIDLKLKLVKNYTLSLDTRDKVYACLAHLKGANTYYRTEAIKTIQNEAAQKELLKNIITDPSERTDYRINLCRHVTHAEERNHHLEAFVNDKSLEFHRRAEAALLLDPSASKDAVLIGLVSSLDLKDLHTSMNLILAISDEALEFRDNLLNQVIQFSLQLLSELAVNQAASEMAMEELLSANTALILNTFAAIKTPTPAIIESLAEQLIQNPHLNCNQQLYQCFLQHNLSELVLNTMHGSVEGLEGEALEGLKKMKLAAAKAIMNIDNENMDAMTIIIALEAQGGNSPYHLYKTVLQKSKELIDFDGLLERKQDQLACLLDSGQRVCLSQHAYGMPVVMDAQWQDAFEDVNFSYFTDVIKNVCKNYREKQEIALSQTEDILKIERFKKEIKDNQDLESNLLEYFSQDGRSVLQSALNTRSRTASHGNKMKAIALYIDKENQNGTIENALTKLAELRENMKTCKGGDLQAIDIAYMHIGYANSKTLQGNETGLTVGEAMLEKERQKVSNVLYKMRLNWVLENTNEIRNQQVCVQYSPTDLDTSFPKKLNTLLQSDYLNSDGVFGNTHIGLAIVGIAGEALGLRPNGTHPSFDMNCVSVEDFIQNPQLTKLNILEAFSDAFTFENTWQAMSQELWDSLATVSQLPLDQKALFMDETCSEPVDLSGINSQDPMARGVLAFIDGIAGAKKSLANAAADDSVNEYIQLDLKQEILKLMDHKEFFYKDALGDVDSITVYTGFSKEGLAKILQELGFLKVLS